MTRLRESAVRRLANCEREPERTRDRPEDMNQPIRLFLPIAGLSLLTACSPLSTGVEGRTTTAPVAESTSTVVVASPTAPLPATTETPSSEPELTATVPPLTPTATARPLPTAGRLPERVPSALPPETGEAPEDVIAAVLSAARQQLNLPPDSPADVIRAQAVTWSDGALGCSEPGGVYTQAEVPGYWIEIDIGGQRLDYRVPADRPIPVLCRP